MSSNYKSSKSDKSDKVSPWHTKTIPEFIQYVIKNNMIKPSEEIIPPHFVKTTATGKLQQSIYALDKKFGNTTIYRYGVVNKSYNGTIYSGIGNINFGEPKANQAASGNADKNKKEPTPIPKDSLGNDVGPSVSFMMKSITREGFDLILDAICKLIKVEIPQEESSIEFINRFRHDQTAEWTSDDDNNFIFSECRIGIPCFIDETNTDKFPCFIFNANPLNVRWCYVKYGFTAKATATDLARRIGGTMENRIAGIRRLSGTNQSLGEPLYIQFLPTGITAHAKILDKDKRGPNDPSVIRNLNIKFGAWIASTVTGSFTNNAIGGLPGDVGMEYPSIDPLEMALFIYYPNILKEYTIELIRIPNNQVIQLAKDIKVYFESEEEDDCHFTRKEALTFLKAWTSAEVEETEEQPPAVIDENSI